MIDRTFLRNMIEKENRSKELQARAYDSYIKNNSQPCEEQLQALQEAADLEFEMANMNQGSEKDRHRREQFRIENEINKFRTQLSKTKAESKNANKSPAAGAQNEESALERAVRTWRKPIPKHDFNDVSGMEDLKAKLREAVACYKSKELREYLEIPKLNAFFFVGAPGCGKTFISEAFTHEVYNLLKEEDVKLDFISVMGSDIIGKYAGEAETAVTRLFDEAMKQPCVLFVDEVDSLCKNRSLQYLPEYAANITTSFLLGYNRIHTEDCQVIFLGATNYPGRVDPAMLDRTEVLRLPLPDKNARKAAFVRMMQHKVKNAETNSVSYVPIFTMADDLTYDLIAEETHRYNYRDIERLCAIVKKTIFHELLGKYLTEERAVAALKSGEYILTREKFEDIRSRFNPAQKEKILKELKEWETMVQEEADVVLDSTDVNIYDCRD